MNIFHKALLSAVALAALQACTSVPIENAKLSAAQAEFTTAQNTPAVPALASAELHDAEVTLDQARAAWGTQEKRSEVDHLAYLASKKVAIAQTVANQRLAEKAINEAQGQRQQTLLVARTLEAQSAQRSAESAQRDAQASQLAAGVAIQQAQSSADQTAMARQDAMAAEANAAQLQARLSELDAKKTERGMVVTIGDLLFDNNSATLKPGAEQSVQRLGAFLKAYPARTALIEGYTDSVGSADSNQSLSERRASSVRVALLAVGVASDRLVTRGYGEGYPVGSNQSADGRLSNRREEIILSDDVGRTQAR
ncbi:MAG: OmpA family protein [Rhodoferax sp.]|nr:OmpA family protein [Rhodoferax sp.]